MSLLETNIVSIVESIGYFGTFIVIFAESSLFFSFFLPGSTLLFTAGFLASQDFFNITLLLTVVILAAIAGDSFGYWFGSQIGEKLFEKKDSYFFRKKHLTQTELFYKKHGAGALIVGRFIPIIRTFVPMLAGMGKMKYKSFLKFNIIGGVLWCLTMVYAGFFLGSLIPRVNPYLFSIVIIIIIFSFVPVILELRKKPQNEKDD